MILQDLTPETAWQQCHAQSVMLRCPPFVGKIKVIPLADPLASLPETFKHIALLLPLLLSAKRLLASKNVAHWFFPFFEKTLFDCGG